MTLHIDSLKSVQFINQEIGWSYKSCLFSDLIIITNDGEVKCHQVILGLASQQLHQLFVQHRADNDEDIVILLPELPLEHLENVLSCLYKGIDVKEIGNKNLSQDIISLLGINIDKFVSKDDDDDQPKLEPFSTDSCNVKMESDAERNADFHSHSHFLQELCENEEELLSKSNDLFSDNVYNNQELDGSFESVRSEEMQESKSGKIYFYCDICQRKFSQENLLNLHKQHHLSGQAFQCSKCPKIFTSNHRLQKHFIKHTHSDIDIKTSGKLESIKSTDITIPAMQIKTNIVSKETKKNEKRKKTKAKQNINFDCEHCDKKFSQKSHLERHMDKHGDPQYHCNICGRMFKSKKGLEYHIKIHEENLQYKCKICDRAFVTRQKLILHERSKHTGDKPYVCEVCGMGFMRSDKLTIHKRRLHTGERPYQCADCEWAGVDSSSLIHHKKKHTNQAKHFGLDQNLVQKIKQEFNKQLVVKTEEKLRDQSTLSTERFQDISTHTPHTATTMQLFPTSMEQFKYYYQNKL